MDGDYSMMAIPIYQWMVCGGIQSQTGGQKHQQHWGWKPGTSNHQNWYKNEIPAPNIGLAGKTIEGHHQRSDALSWGTPSGSMCHKGRNAPTNFQTALRKRDVLTGSKEKTKGACLKSSVLFPVHFRLSMWVCYKSLRPRFSKRLPCLLVTGSAATSVNVLAKSSVQWDKLPIPSTLAIFNRDITILNTSVAHFQKPTDEFCCSQVEMRLEDANLVVL